MFRTTLGLSLVLLTAANAAVAQEHPLVGRWQLTHATHSALPIFSPTLARLGAEGQQGRTTVLLDSAEITVTREPAGLSFVLRAFIRRLSFAATPSGGSSINNSFGPGAFSAPADTISQTGEVSLGRDGFEFQACASQCWPVQLTVGRVGDSMLTTRAFLFPSREREPSLSTLEWRKLSESR
jgi:hypothetical protein